MIKIFASRFNVEPHEAFTGSAPSISAWLSANVKGYAPEVAPQFSATLNGELVPVPDWSNTGFSDADVLCLTLEPKGTELFFGALFLVAIRTMTPKIPKVNSSGTQEGKDINEASIKGNKVKLNDPIPDIAGFRKVYPSYLSPPRRYFAGPRDQRMQMIVCIGIGSYQIEPDKILIGDTPLISLGADADYKIYPPGADLSGDPRSYWWNDVTEVGSSSNGASGLELTTSVALTPSSQVSSYQFTDHIVGVPNGSGAFPSDWSSGLIVRIISPYQYEFIDGGASADIIRGNALAMLNPSVGDQIEIAGVNSGTYTVASYTPASGNSAPQMTLAFSNGAPVTEFTLGTIACTIGPVGLRYRITVFSTSQITVNRLTSGGATDSGWPGFQYLQTANGSVSLDAASLQGGYRGPFAVCPEDQKTDLIEFDVQCPSGLIGIGKDGYRYTVSVAYQVEYRDMDVSGAWTVFNYTESAASLDSVGFSHQIQLPYRMRAEMRMKKVYLSTDSSPEVSNSIVWYGARSKLPSKSVYSDATVATFQVRGGDRLSSTSESQVSVQATRILPVRENGAWQPPRPTRDIAPYALYLLKQVGYEDRDLDLAEWDRLDSLWRARGDHYDNVHSSNSTVQAILEDVLQAGFAEITVNLGKLRPVRDEPQDQFEALYTPAAMTEPLAIKFDAVKPDDYDGVDVEYTDSGSWQVATVQCRLPGDEGLRVQKVQANGVTNRNKAYQIGMRQRRALKYRRKTFDWSTEMSAFNSIYLNYVQVAGDVPGYAQSGVMHAYDPQSRIVTAGEAFDWPEGAGPFYLSVRRADGTNSGPYVVSRVDDFRLRLSEALDFKPVLNQAQENPHLLFGLGWPVQITEIDPNDTFSAHVEARNYDGRVYLDDDKPADN